MLKLYIKEKKNIITRIYYINSNVKKKLFYLRYLLLNVSNSIFFENLRTINENVISIYYNVYTIKKLLHNDVE